MMPVLHRPARLDPKAKAVLDTWPILMSSEKSREIRQAATIQRVAERERLTKETPKVIKSRNPLPSQHIDDKPFINLNFLPPPRLRASIPNQTSRLSPPPPYSAATASATTNNGSPSLSLQEKCTTSIRRTARIPPKESIAAEAPCGFETEADYNEAVDNDNDHRLIQEIDDSCKLGITINIHQFHGNVGTMAIISACPSLEHFS